MSEVLELSILSSSYISISKSDRDSITEAKRIIDSQLAFAPSCEELAKKVNISVSKLTKGFNSLFGTIGSRIYYRSKTWKRLRGFFWKVT